MKISGLASSFLSRSSPPLSEPIIRMAKSWASSACFPPASPASCGGGNTHDGLVGPLCAVTRRFHEPGFCATEPFHRRPDRAQTSLLARGGCHLFADDLFDPKMFRDEPIFSSGKPAIQHD
jgi:hypothetical protein